MGAGARWAIGGVLSGLALVVAAVLVVVGVVAGATGAWFDGVAFADDHQGVVTGVEEGRTPGGRGTTLVDVRWTADGQVHEETGRWVSAEPAPQVGDAVDVHDGSAVDQPTVRPPSATGEVATGTRDVGIGLVVAGAVLGVLAVTGLVLTAVWARRAPRRTPPGGAR